jgi:transcriptional regulator with XRE-family HTH domain
VTGLDIAHAYGIELRLERERRGWTQAHLAEQIGIARPNLARSEAGHHTPRLEQFVRSAEVFQMEPAELFRRVIERARGDGP